LVEYMPVIVPLSSGAEMRLTGEPGAPAVVCVDGGQAGEVEGTWSASLEWLVGRLAPRFPSLAFGEVRYRIKSWKRLDLCAEDAWAALDAAVEAGAGECALLGFSMGGAVSLRVASHPSVSTVIGLAPWLPDRLPVDALDGRRLVVIHGMLDAYLPGIPGVSPKLSRRGFERALARGVEASYTLIPGGLHGIAVRAPSGRLLPLPRARRWARLVGKELERFQADAPGRLHRTRTRRPSTLSASSCRRS
jgi:pimeloyl-ACP methyl ester carboxylesterase